MQPIHRIIDTPFLLCSRCARTVSPELLQMGGTRLVKFQCDGSKVLEMGLAYALEDEETLISCKLQILHCFILKY